MKKLSMFVLAAVFIAMASVTAFAADGMQFLVSASTQSLAVGDVIEYTITLDTPEDIYGIDCTLALNENFKVVGFAAGDVNQSELSCNEVDGKFIFLYMDSDLESPITTGQVLCTIQLKATAPCDGVQPIALTSANGAAIIDNSVEGLSVSMAAVDAVTVTTAAEPDADDAESSTGDSADSTDSTDGAASSSTTQAEDEPFVMLDGVTYTQEEVQALIEESNSASASASAGSASGTDAATDDAAADDTAQAADDAAAGDDAALEAEADTDANAAAVSAGEAAQGTGGVPTAIYLLVAVAVCGGAAAFVAYRKRNKTPVTAATPPVGAVSGRPTPAEPAAPTTPATAATPPVEATTPPVGAVSGRPTPAEPAAPTTPAAAEPPTEPTEKPTE